MVRVKFLYTSIAYVVILAFPFIRQVEVDSPTPTLINYIIKYIQTQLTSQRNKYETGIYELQIG